jgi:hypothetical protein
MSNTDKTTPWEITSRLITADKPLASTFKPQSFLLIPPAEIQAMKKEIKDCHEEMALMVKAMQNLEEEIKRLRALVPETPKLGTFDDVPEWTQPRSLLPRGL